MLWQVNNQNNGMVCNVPGYKNHCLALDDQKKPRIILDKKNAIYAYANSRGTEIRKNATKLSSSEFDDLMLLIKTASTSCPVTLKVDRDSFDILEATGTCDPLASAEAELTVG